MPYFQSKIPFAFIVGLSLFACGGSNRPAPKVPELSAERSDNLDFWWKHGESVGQHLQVVMVSGDIMLLSQVDLPTSDIGWKELYRPVLESVPVKAESMSLSKNVYSKSEATLKKRIDEELGGLASHQQAVKDGLPIHDGSVDVVLVDSHWVAFETSSTTAEDRERAISSLVFARAGARAAEKTANDSAAYFKSYSHTLEALGWVMVMDKSATIESDDLLIANLAKTAPIGSTFIQLGFTPPPPK